MMDREKAEEQLPLMKMLHVWLEENQVKAEPHGLLGRGGDLARETESSTEITEYEGRRETLRGWMCGGSRLGVMLNEIR